MIDLITGLPGNAKTLFAIAFVKNWAEKDSRPVFYSGIPELKIPNWNEIDPMKWMDAPPNSIVMIDECQRVFRNRTLGQVPGKHVTDLETHRHLGIDLIFITQHPSLIDPAIRRLAGRHRHLVRIWGMQASTIHEWGAVRDNCDKPVARRDSEKSKWKFDKSVFALYKSAEVHTVKRTIPMRVKLLFLVPLVLAAAVYSVYRLVVKKPAERAAAVAVQSGAVPGAPGAVPVKKFDPVADAREFVFNRTERIEGLPHTAPRYDEMTKPTAVPVPAACVASHDRCNCYTQQGTAMAVNNLLCREIVDRGWFVDFDSGGGKHGHDVREDRAPSIARADAVPLSSIKSTSPVAADVRTFGDENGFGVLGRRPGRGS